jgi:hypothetical protein
MRNAVGAPGGRKTRTYYVYPGVAGRPGLSGKDKTQEFIRLCQATGVPESWFAGAESIGPLAEFAGVDRWVESPVKNGVVLIGDAAASSNPSWGCGLSLTLLDVEHLAKALCASNDWSVALGRYAEEHDEYSSALRRILGWMTELTWTPGPEADKRRARVFPPMLSDPRGFPDSIGLGPFGSERRPGEEARAGPRLSRPTKVPLFRLCAPSDVIPVGRRIGPPAASWLSRSRANHREQFLPHRPPLRGGRKTAVGGLGIRGAPRKRSISSKSISSEVDGSASIVKLSQP